MSAVRQEDAPRSRPQQLQDAVYGDLSHLPAMDLRTAEAAGLCGRILLLAERHEALGQQCAAGGGSDVFFENRGAARYRDWLRTELTTAARKTDKIESVGFGPVPGAVYLRPIDRVALIPIPVGEGEVEFLSSRPNFWESDAFYIGSPDFYAEADDQLRTQIAEALSIDEADSSEQARYDLGYRDGLQSVSLAAIRSGLELAKCRDMITTALDAHANNAPDFERGPTP